MEIVPSEMKCPASHYDRNQIWLIKLKKLWIWIQIDAMKMIWNCVRNGIKWKKKSERGYKLDKKWNGKKNRNRKSSDIDLVH